MPGKRPVHVLRIARGLAKAKIEVSHELRRIGVGRVNRVDAAQPQFLDQPILQRLVGALDATLGLRGIGTDDVDVELIEGPPNCVRPLVLSFSEAWVVRKTPCLSL